MIRQGRTAYADMAHGPVHVAGAINVEQPVAGFYRMRLGRDTVMVAIRVFFGPPNDPVTGEQLDRSWRWQAIGDDGQLLDWERVWPACARDPITELEFKARVERRRWAQQAAPDSAFADHTRKYDPLSRSEPLPF